MLLLPRAFIKTEKEGDIVYRQHSICFKIPLNVFHLNRLPPLALDMQVALFDFRVSIFDIKVNLLPAVTYPTNIPSMVGLIFILHIVGMSGVYFSNQTLHDWQRIFLVLLFCQPKVPFMIDHTGISFIVDSVDSMVAFKGFSYNS